MRIKKISLNNIRSYKNETIEFPEGSTLLAGDIGTGKTSVLLGIEFALFGLQPGQKGSSLLRNGEDEGSVSIEFEIDGNEISIQRYLKKGKSVTQNYCAISTNGKKEEISVTEIKSRVLSLLNYPEEFAKKQNLLYRFTVYTPQEEMKQIILQDSETRINTIRHVFGIDKYKRILENSAILLAKVREEKRVNQALTINLENDQEYLLTKENDLESKRYNLVSVEKDLFNKKETREKIEEEKNELSKQIEKKREIQQEIEKGNIMISNKRDLISENLKKQKIYESQINELQALFFDESKITSLESNINSIKNQLNELSEKKIHINSNINALNYKINENEKIKEKLTHIEVCPTCLQDVNLSYKENVLKKMNSGISENNQRIDSLRNELTTINSQVAELNSNIAENERQLNELRMLKLKIQGIEEKQKFLEELQTSNLNLDKDINILNSQISTLKKSLLEYGKYENLFEIKQKEYSEALQLERALDIKVAEIKKEIEFCIQQIEELKNKIEKGKLIEKKLNFLSELENWISKKFIPLISFIEKNVMLSLKSEFGKLFEEWFCMLVSENIHVKLLDDFTPSIEQQDYDIEYNYLSGGERTAIALAYRLALNQVINSLLGKVKTRDLVILDEPTDGFSDQQLDKMRDVLQELNVKQLIIVSHEQKIEGFVDNVIKFKKNQNVSWIEQ